MLTLDFHPTGRHFLQIPGPSPVPDRVLRAMSYPTIDHRGPEFALLGLKVLADVQKIFKTRQPVIIYPASGTGAWEAALVNTLSVGDHVLMYETGHFAALWNKLARWLTPLWWPLLPLNLLPCSTCRPTPAAPWANTSVTVAKTL